jgi:hypothetical protein
VALNGGRRVALADGIFYEVGGFFDVQLSHGIGTVMFYRAHAYKEQIGNLFVFDSLGNEL